MHLLAGVTGGRILKILKEPKLGISQKGRGSGMDGVVDKSPEKPSTVLHRPVALAQHWHGRGKAWSV